MTLLDFIKLLMSYKKWLITLPLLVASLVFFLTSKQPDQFISQALLYTGVVPTSDGTVGGTVRVDVFVVNNAMDNIQTILTSRQVLEEASLRIMARHIVRMKLHPSVIEKTLTNFWNEHPELLKQYSSFSDESNLYTELQKKSSDKNIRWMLEDDASIYSIEKVKENLKIKRSGSSDLLDLQYTSTEASIARETLNFVLDAFTKRFKELKKSEVGSMVQFFEKEVAKAATRLSNCAEEMKQFQVKNRIINYYEQTHLTAIETEHLNGQYYDELMKLAASEQAFQDLKIKLGNPYEQALSSGDIIQTQQTISELMTRKQITKSTSKEFAVLNDSIQLEEDHLRKSINKLYIDGRTEEGVSKKEILKQWLDQFIALSEAQARVVVIEKRKGKQEKEYDFFAPLGSVLHNYERQMDVAEREYLDLLHSLNQARLRQQSVETSTTLATVDPPTAPLKPEPSKRKLLVVVGWLGSLLIIVGVILFIEYFDSTLQSPDRAEAKTGLTVLGALTNDMNGNIGQLAQANLMLRYLANVSKQNLNNKILFIEKTSTSNTPIALQFGEWLAARKQKIAFAGNASFAGNGFPVLESEIESANNFDTVIASYSSINQASTDWKLLQSVNEVVYAIPAEYTWTSADNQTVSLIEKITSRKPLLLLTDTDERRLEGWLGELPKKRSRLRKWVKKLVKFQFN